MRGAMPIREEIRPALSNDFAANGGSFFVMREVYKSRWVQIPFFGRRSFLHDEKLFVALVANRMTHDAPVALPCRAVAGEVVAGASTASRALNENVGPRFILSVGSRLRFLVGHVGSRRMSGPESMLACAKVQADIFPLTFVYPRR